MLKACAQYVERLWKAAGKVGSLSTKSIATGIFESGLVSLCLADYTVFAQINSPFTQHVERILYLLNPNLYPLSTVPMTTTNLIKE